MSKIFRAIRLKALRENRSVKFLGYIVVEIFLVVIGIVIALRLNDRSVENNKRLDELKICKELKEDLVFNLSEIDTEISLMNYRSRDVDSILYFLTSDLKYDSSMAIYTSSISIHGIFNIAQSTYDYIKSDGAKLISNDKIRKSLMLLYDRHFFNIKAREKIMEQTREEELEPLLFKNFAPLVINKASDSVYYNRTVYPIDFESLKTNSEFLNVLISFKWIVDIRVRLLPDTRNKLNALIELLDEHIIMLEKKCEKG